MTYTDNAKQRFSALGLKPNDLSKSQIEKLIQITNKVAQEKQIMNGNLTFKVANTENESIRVNCDSHYFDNREAYTFYPNGEVSIAYWADGLVSKYFAQAFEAWLDQLVAQPA